MLIRIPGVNTTTKRNKRTGTVKRHTVTQLPETTA